MPIPYRHFASSIYWVAWTVGYRVSVTWHELDALLSHVWPSVANQVSHDPSMAATKVQSNAGTKS
jgi:hypothetical protein